MTYDISDYDRLLIYITDGYREWYVPKFRIFMVVEEPYIRIYWTDTEKGFDGYQRAIIAPYTDIVFGYLTPSSASEVETVIESYQVSAWTDIPVPTTPDLEEVLTQGNSGGALEITNIADGTAPTSAATVQQLPFSWHIAAYGANPPGATSFFISGSGFIAITSLPDRIAIRPKFACRIDEVQILWQTIGTAGSNQDISCYIRVNNTTDYLIATIGSTDTQKEFYNAAMNGGAGITMNGTTDYYVIKFTTPTWGTAPTNVNYQGQVRYIPT